MVDAVPAEVAAMKTRLAICVLAVALASAPGCVVYHTQPVANARKLLAVPYRSDVEVTTRDGSTTTLHPPVELVDDTVFGWYRREGQEGLLRVGVPMREVRTVLARSIDWPTTVAATSVGAVLGVLGLIKGYCWMSGCVVLPAS